MNPFHRLHNLRMANDEAGYRMTEMRPRFDLLAGRHENGSAPCAVAVRQLFQTPPTLATRLVNLLELRTGERVLEPSAGLGRLVDALQPYRPVITAVEIAPDCTGELYRRNLERVTIMQRDFLAVTTDEIGAFDAVAMNPPFTMGSDIKHILHARSFLRPGGRLAAICMDGQSRRERLKPLASQWIELGPGLFRESGTNTATVLMLIQ